MIRSVYCTWIRTAPVCMAVNVKTISVLVLTPKRSLHLRTQSSTRYDSTADDGTGIPGIYSGRSGGILVLPYS